MTLSLPAMSGKSSMRFRLPSTGVAMFLLVTMTSFVQIIDAIWSFGQAPIVAGAIACAYLFVMVKTVVRGRLGWWGGWLQGLLLLWLVVMLIRGFSADYDFLRGLFVSPYLFLPFTLPFAAGGFGIAEARRYIGLVGFVGLCFLASAFFNLGAISSREAGVVGFIENASHSMAYPTFFLLFYFSRIENYQRIIAVLVFFIGLYLAISFGRRSLTWTFAWAGIFALILNIYDGKQFLRRHPGALLAVIGAICVAVAYLISGWEKIMSPLLERIAEDSRSSVLYDFASGMSFSESLVGRGIGGEYYLWTTNLSVFESDYRNIIEIGWLNLVLYGGWILLSLVAVIYVRAAYLGLFRSNNQLCKAFAALILLHALESYPAGVFFFNAHFLLIWFGVAICFYRSLREMTDDEILRSSKGSAG